MPDVYTDAESSVWSDSEDEASASGWLGSGAARPTDAMASHTWSISCRSALHWSMREADPPAQRDRQLHQVQISPYSICCGSASDSFTDHFHSVASFSRT